MDAGPVVPWAPSGFPTRQSPHYTLRSIAFAKDAERVTASTAVAKTKSSGTPGSARGAPLPRIDAAQPHAGVAANDAFGSVALVPVGSTNTGPAADFDVPMARLEAKREAALADYEKVQDQLCLTHTKLVRERRLRAATESQVKEFEKRTIHVVAKTRDESARIYGQQQELRTLRLQLKQIQAMQESSTATYSQFAADYSGAMTQHSQGSLAQTLQPSEFNIPMASTDDLQYTDNVDPNLPALLVDMWPHMGASPGENNEFVLRGDSASRQDGNDAAEPVEEGEPNVDASLEDLRVEINKVAQACDAGASSSPRGPAGYLAHGVSNAGASSVGNGAQIDDMDEDEDEAEIDIVRQANGVSVARLRHPCGAEALVDLSSAVCVMWRLADGRTVPACDVWSLWPHVSQLTPHPEQPQWQLTALDDSNNEPSATLTCNGGDKGRAWQVQRTFTVGSGWIHEEISMQNLSDVELSVSVGEEVKGAKTELASGQKPVRLKRQRDDGPVAPPVKARPIVVTVPPRDGFSAKQRWLADA